MKHVKNLMLLFVALLLVAAGCSNNGEQSSSEGDAENKEQVLYFAIGGEVKDLDAHFLAGLPKYAVGPNIYNALVRFPMGTADVENLEPDLAESWETNDDATQWTFHLREGVQWHKDYGELTAEDVKWSFERVMDPENGISHASNYTNVESIETTDDLTVVFHLKEPDPNFLTKVADYQGGYIVNKDAIEANEVIGTGPFVFEEYKTQDSVTLVKNEKYFRGEPKLDKIVYKIMTDQTAIDVAMEKGDIHIALGSSDPLWVEEKSQNSDLIIEVGKPLNMAAFYLNTSKPPFDDIRVRQAFAHAIDVQKYVDTYIVEGVGQVPQGLIPSDVVGAENVGNYEYNPEKAKQLLKEAGYEDGLDLPPQYVSQAPHILNPMLFAQDQLKQVGINMPLEQIEHTTYQENMRKGMNNVSYVSLNRIPHVANWFKDLYYGPSSVGTPTGNVNYSHYSGSDDLIEQALVETDPEKAEALYKEIQQQMIDAYPAVPLAEYGTTIVRRAEVNLGYNDNKHEGSLHYYIQIDENTFIE